jgi:hypothetical protein
LLTYTCLTGAADASYTVDRSRLPAPHASCVLGKVSVSGGKFITGGFIFGIGNEEKPVHVSRDGHVPKLQWISKKFVALWDEEDERGWLVNGASALLHLLRTSLEYNMLVMSEQVQRNDSSNRPYRRSSML